MKKILISAMIISACAFASEITVVGDSGYDFNILNKDKGIDFKPILPITVSLKFQPSEIDLSGELNIENKEIDGLFSENSKVTEGLSLDGKINFTSSPVYKNLKIAASLDLIANKGNKFADDKDTDNGDAILGLGVNYGFGSIDTGVLIYYKSNQIMSPKAIGGTYLLKGYDSELKVTAAYNLIDLFRLQTYMNVNNIDLSADGCTTDCSIYYYGKNSSISKLVPVIFNLDVNNKVNALDNLSFFTTFNTNLKYLDYEASLNETKIKDPNQVKSVYTDGRKSSKTDLIIAKEIAKTLKDLDTTDSDPIVSLKNKKIDFDINTEFNVKYNVLRELELNFNDKIGYKYNSNKLGKVYKNKMISNSFNFALTYTYNFEQVEGLSLISKSEIGLKSEFALGTTPKFTIRNASDVIDSSKYSNANSLTVGSNLLVKYNIFETLSVRGGFGIELETIFAQSKDESTNKSLSKYNRTSPKLFIGVDYKW